MSKLDQAARLGKYLQAHRYPVSRQRLQEKLECSEATIKRLIAYCRDSFGMPIRYDRKANGYRLDRDAETSEIPGLWLTQDEIHALLVIDQLLDNLAPGLVSEEIRPFRKRLQSLLRLMGGSPGEHHRIRLLSQARRQRQYAHFTQLAEAVLQRRQLHIAYHGRGRDRHSQRTLSPQRLVHYRENWYLDAWCHQRQALRTFSADRIQSARLLPQRAKDIDEAELDRALGGAYGIFAGEPDQTAIIHFTPKAARWVASEQWHPEQQAQWLPDGRYELRIPYHDPTELIGDILRHGPDAEVIAPDSLRRQLAEHAARLNEIYKK